MGWKSDQLSDYWLLKDGCLPRSLSNCTVILWWENLKKIYHLEDLGVDGKILKSISMKSVGRMCTKFTWLRIGTKGGLL